MNKGGHIGIGILLATVLGLCGFVLVAMLASRLGVAENQGLAGGAIVMGYGLIGALAGVVTAIVIAARTPARPLLILAGFAGIVVVALLFKLVPAGLKLRDESNAALQQSYDQLLTFRVELLNAGTPDSLPYSKLTADWVERKMTLSRGDRTCTANMKGNHALKFLGALREAEGVVYRNPDPCSEFTDPALYQLDFRIDEALPPISQASIRVTPACLQRHPALSAPKRTAEEIIRETNALERC